MTTQITVIFVLMFHVHYVNSDVNACAKLTRCAVKRCFSQEKTREALHTLTPVGMFSSMVDQFSFVCVATKCRDVCTECEHCHYALDQISKLASGAKTKMVCPKMETCSVACFREDILRVNACAKKRCNIHCFDGDCPHCINVTKRIFVRLCREYDVTNLPNVNFHGTCFDLFDHVLNAYVSGKRA